MGLSKQNGDERFTVLSHRAAESNDAISIFRGVTEDVELGGSVLALLRSRPTPNFELRQLRYRPLPSREFPKQITRKRLVPLPTLPNGKLVHHPSGNYKRCNETHRVIQRRSQFQHTTLGYDLFGDLFLVRAIREVVRCAIAS